MKKGKPRLELLPPRALVEVAKAFMDGADKYGDHSYLDGSLDWGERIGAILRHLNHFNQREDFAEDSKVHHLAHVAANAMILLEAYYLASGKDTRFRTKQVETKSNFGPKKPWNPFLES